MASFGESGELVLEDQENEHIRNVMEDEEAKEEEQEAVMGERKEQQRTDWSKSDKMKNAVATWDALQDDFGRGELDMEQWSGIMTRGWPSKTKFARRMGINPATLSRYIKDDVNERTAIGTKLGRKRLEDKMEAELKRLGLGKYDGMPFQIEEMQERRKKDQRQRDKLQQRVPTEEQFVDALQDPAKKISLRGVWDGELKELCRFVAPGDKKYYRAEQEYVHRCNQTRDVHEVSYEGPRLGDTPINTRDRRERMDKKLNEYERMIVRRTVLLSSGHRKDEHALLVTLHFLLRRYDRKGLFRHPDIEPSKMSWKLLEAQDDRERQMRQIYEERRRLGKEKLQRLDAEVAEKNRRQKLGEDSGSDSEEDEDTAAYFKCSGVVMGELRKEWRKEVELEEEAEAARIHRHCGHDS